MTENEDTRRKKILCIKSRLSYVQFSEMCHCEVGACRGNVRRAQCKQVLAEELLAKLDEIDKQAQEDEIRSFAGEIVDIGNRKMALVRIPNPQRLRENPAIPRYGEKVKINDTRYLVVGVETRLNLMDPPFVSEDVGLQILPATELGTTFYKR